MSQAGFFFYTGDWLKDTRVLTVALRGAWIDLLCVLQEQNGEITWSLDDFATFWTVERRIGDAFVRDLSRLKIADVTEMSPDVFRIISRKIKKSIIIRENNKLRKQKERDRKRKYRASHESVTRCHSRSSSSSSESSSESSSNLKEKKKIASSLRKETPPTPWPVEDIWLSELLKRQIFTAHCAEQVQDYEWWEFTVGSLGGIDKAFIEKEFAKISAWWRENPTKHKTANGMKRFLRTWLEKAKNEQGRLYAVRR